MARGEAFRLERQQQRLTAGTLLVRALDDLDFDRAALAVGASDLRVDLQWLRLVGAAEVVGRHDDVGRPAAVERRHRRWNIRLALERERILRGARGRIRAGRRLDHDPSPCRLPEERRKNDRGYSGNLVDLEARRGHGGTSGVTVA